MRSSAITARSLPRLLCPATTRRNVNKANTSATIKSTERLRSECSPAVREAWTSLDRSFGQDSRGRRDFNRDKRRPQYGPCAVCGGMSHSALYCNKRCMFCKQAHDAGQCELFRNFQDLAKFVRIKGTKEELPPELKSVVQESHLN
ncbi:hypothetical protein PC120_g26556 [Phytophthora cactorum]|nr:hypothetical protein PC120_g26556 [Phytophthora cactorum]